MVTIRKDLPLRPPTLLPGTVLLPGSESEVDLESWLGSIRDIVDHGDLDDLRRASVLVSSRAFDSQHQRRSSAYLAGIGMADILAHLQVDEATLTAAVLFRSVREGSIAIDEVQDFFGPEVHALVAGTLSMGQLSETIEQSRRLEDHFENNEREHLSGIYKMLISVTEDVRVVLVKLAERTFAIRELAQSAPERQQRVAREILTIYAPLAHRLGIAQLKWELEDLAFRFLAPERYKEIAALLNEKRLERESYIQAMQKTLRTALADEKITAEVTGRVKHIYSIYRKMQSKQLSFDQLYDIRALRVLVEGAADCYHALGVVHQLWAHIPGQFDDYITNPKPNGYRSLHTAVIAQQRSLEVQIRTHTMHHEAELGVCAHFHYKEDGSRSDRQFSDKLHSLRAVLEHYQERLEDSDPTDLDADAPAQRWEAFEKIYVFSRDGDIRELPKNATVLDFAYHVHTEVGNHCYAARVNRRYVPLNYILRTGEQVEILTRPDREPSRDWLMHSLGYIHTARARDKLRHWFRQQDRSKNIDAGRSLLTRELRRLDLHPKSIDLADYTDFFHVKSGDDILCGLVTGDISLHQLTQHISRQLDPDADTDELVLRPVLNPRASAALSSHGILIDGLDNVELSLAQCCQPVHGEAIAGYITQSRGVSIHRQDCAEYLRLSAREPGRAVDANWELQPGRGQQVMIVVEAYDRRGLLKDLTQVIFADQINIRQVNTITESDGIAHMKLLVEVRGLAQLSHLLARLEQQPGIISARRQGSAVAPPEANTRPLKNP